VRSLALSDAAPNYTGQMGWRSLAPIRHDTPDEVQFWLGDGCFFGLFPVSNKLTYGFGYINEPERRHDPALGRLKRLRERFAAFGGLIKIYLANLECDEQIHCAAIESLELDHWRKGRVVLIGDAAHASSPMMGQGGCKAIEDAAVLAELLKSAKSIEDALDAYVLRTAGACRLGPEPERRARSERSTPVRCPRWCDSRERRPGVSGPVRAAAGRAVGEMARKPVGINMRDFQRGNTRPRLLFSKR
jgi:FAD binding domain